MKKIYLLAALVLGVQISDAQIFKKKKKVSAETETTVMESDTIFPVGEKQKDIETPKREKKKIDKKSTESLNTSTEVQTSEPIEGQDEANLSKKVLLELGVRFGANYLQPKMEAFNTPQLNASGVPIVSNGKIQRETLSVSGNSQFGGSLGGFFRVTKGVFYFQPEVLASMKGGLIQSTDPNNMSNTIDARYISLDVPLTFGLRAKELRLFTAPVVSIPFQHQKDLINTLKTYTLAELPQNAFKSYHINYLFGLGYDIGLWEIDLRYELGLTPAANQTIGVANLPSTFKMSSGMLQFSVGRVFSNRVK